MQIHKDSAAQKRNSVAARVTEREKDTDAQQIILF